MLTVELQLLHAPLAWLKTKLPSVRAAVIVCFQQLTDFPVSIVKLPSLTVPLAIWIMELQNVRLAEIVNNRLLMACCALIPALFLTVRAVLITVELKIAKVVLIVSFQH